MNSAHCDSSLSESIVKSDRVAEDNGWFRVVKMLLFRSVPSSYYADWSLLLVLLLFVILLMRPIRCKQAGSVSKGEEDAWDNAGLQYEII